MLESLSPSKQKAQRGNSLYRYYAGFPATFVESLVQRLNVQPDAVVLDPWNGAGTTTQVCAHLGIQSIGIDANPFMRVVAELRSSSRASILRSVASTNAAIREWPVSDEVGEVPHIAAGLFRKLDDAGIIGNGDPVPSFVFASAARAIFETVRTRNPTWFSSRRSKEIRTTEIEVSKAVLHEIGKLESWASNGSEKGVIAPPVFITADARQAWVGRRVDHIISSPPYLTRIDYVKKTLPELLFIQDLYGLDIDRLRRMMLGTVLTGNGAPTTNKVNSATATDVLKRISKHESKASATYYLRFFQDYFHGLELILQNVTPLLRDGGTVTLVTQGSFYKELYVDLPLVVVEIMRELGFVESDRNEFTTSNHMAAINTRSFASTQRAPAEVVSTFRKNL